MARLSGVRRRWWRRLAVAAEKLRRRAGAGLDESLTRTKGREHAFLVLAAVLLGVLGAYGAIGFRLLIQACHHLFFGTGEYTLELLHALPWWRRLLMPTAGGLAVGLIVWRFAPEVKGSGIPEVIEAVARRGGMIRSRVVLTKAAAAALTIGSGGSAGREGPIVHIGSAIGSAFGQFLQVSAQRVRTFVACGAAAAIAATFNAPIAGAMFSVEVVLGDMRVASMSPVVISSVVATVVSRHHLGDFPAFLVPAYDLVSPRELLLYAVLGVLAALVALAFIRGVFLAADAFERLPLPPWVRPGLGGLCVGGIALGFPHVFGVGYETINAALWGRTGAALLGGVLVAKLLATAVTLGSGGSGGVFAPSLFLGAALGSSFGQVAHHLAPGWTAGSGAYALVGMGALVSAATHAPITAILMIFELTNDYRIIPPLMLSCIVAVLLSTQFTRESIYTESLVRRGFRRTQGHDTNVLRTVEVKEVMDPVAQTVPAGAPLADVLSLLLAGDRTSAVVVDAQGRYRGCVDLADLREILPQTEDLASLVVAADVADSDTPFTVPRDTLDRVMRAFGKTRRDELPVCDSSRSRRVIGVVTRRAVIDAYNRRIFQADLAGGFHSLVEATREGRTVEVMPGVHLGEVEVPGSWLGRSLREADPRRRYGVEVVLVLHPEEPEQGTFPSPELRFGPGDRAVVMGHPEEIRRIRGTRPT